MLPLALASHDWRIRTAHGKNIDCFIESQTQVAKFRHAYKRDNTTPIRSGLHIADRRRRLFVFGTRTAGSISETLPLIARLVVPSVIAATVSLKKGTRNYEEYLCRQSRLQRQ